MSKKNKKNKQSPKPQTMSTVGNAIRQVKSIPNLMSCVFSHKTSETTHEFSWDGPTLNAIWPEVLAFLKWTHDTYNSESQLRLFVNPKTEEWKAWAFPQKARLGMSAKELDETDEGYNKAKEQRAQFGDDWYYWGTVHHHCSSAAFQSGTDQDNERNQDGIHITVGHMDRSTFDIHARLYIGGFKLDGFDMHDFWDIGNELDDLPQLYKSLLVTNARDVILKYQMGTMPASATFNEAWKDNIIDTRPKVVSSSSHNPYGPSFHNGTGGMYIGPSRRILTERCKNNYPIDLARARSELEDMVKMVSCKINDGAGIIKALEFIEDKVPTDIINIIDICGRHDVSPGNVAKYMIERYVSEEMVEDQRRLVAEGGPSTHGKATTQKVLGLPNDNSNVHYWH